jgi:2-methylcitrate dehydratase PrpD
VAIGASRHPSVDVVVAYGSAHGGAPAAPVPGRHDRLDPHYAAMVAGLAAHIDDYDDMHLETVIHPSAAPLGALVAIGRSRGVTGLDALKAFALACEVELRIGQVVSPWHYDAGWHISATCGVIGAAVGAGLLVGLDATALTMAVGLATSQTLGLRVTHGTMAKALQPGKAAANGVLAALLAERGFTAARDGLGGTRGFFDVLSPRAEADRLLDGIGQRWELERNTLKPYPGGVVVHPFIDAALALRGGIPDLGDVASISARCHPLVLELTADPDPADGLHARLSAPHAVAVALLDGAAGLEQFGDARVADRAVAALRRKVALVPDETVARDEAVLEIELANGARLAEHVAHARGSIDRPLTDADLAAKVAALVDPVMPGRAGALMDAVEGLEAAPRLDCLLAAIVPPRSPSP